MTGLYYYLYNEMAFAVLDLLDPVGQVSSLLLSSPELSDTQVYEP